MGALTRGLAIAACALVGDAARAETPAALPAAGGDWSVDASWLSYAEADGRVAVSKRLGNLTREL